MKLGMTSLTFRDRSIEETAKYAKEAGIDGIEWGVSETHASLTDDTFLERIKEASRKNGLEIFSLGAYCNMTDPEDCDKTLQVAIKLGAPIIRIWAGNKSPKECDEAYVDCVVKNTIAMAKKAAAHHIKLGFEYHSYTLTETAESAVSLIKRINCPNVGLYWQPEGNISVEENLANRNQVLPYCIGNMHVQNWNEEESYILLEGISDRLEQYFGDIKEQDYHLMIEFVKDAEPENLNKDAAVLIPIIK